MLALLGEVRGEVDDIAGGATALAGALDHLVRDHSPLDWARAQIALGRALSALGEASCDERAFEQAGTRYDRPGLVPKDQPGVPPRGLAARGRALAPGPAGPPARQRSLVDAARAPLD